MFKQDHTNKKWCNFQGSMKTLDRSSSVESMDIETDNIIANINLADIYKKHIRNLWNQTIDKAYACEAKFV